MKIFILFLALFLRLSSHALDLPLQILVIGGGPAGLATAIEARLQGHSVKVIEKRAVYTRQQWVFLNPNTLELIEKWGIDLSDMAPMDPEDPRVQIVPIQVLESKLQARACLMGAEIVQGTFLHLGNNHTALILTKDGTQQEIAYDLLIGADGARSQVREALGIESRTFDSAEGICALMPANNATFDLSEPIRLDEGHFLRRLQASKGTMVFMQRPLQASVQDLIDGLEKQGWTQEAEAIRREQAAFITGIPVCLTQASTFSSASASALLVGDSAATASFLQGKGANTALKAAELAGEFFKTRSFATFNQKMKAITNEMIHDSEFLYSQPKK